jgi:hypothetical protein
LERTHLWVKFSLKGGVSSLDRKLRTFGPIIPRGFIPRQLCGFKKFPLKLPRDPVSGFLGITPAHSNKKFVMLVRSNRRFVVVKFLWSYQII